MKFTKILARYQSVWFRAQFLITPDGLPAERSDAEHS